MRLLLKVSVYRFDERGHEIGQHVVTATQVEGKEEDDDTLLKDSPFRTSCKPWLKFG